MKFICQVFKVKKNTSEKLPTSPSMKMVLLSILMIGWGSNTYSGFLNASLNLITPKIEQAILLPVIGESLISDEEMIFQKCFDLKDLQDLYIRNSDKSFKPLYVLIHSVPFPSNSVLKHAGNSIIQVTKQQIKSNTTDAYFYFHELQIDRGGRARVDFIYNYDQLTANPMGRKVHLELEKINNVWNITKTQIEGI